MHDYDFKSGINDKNKNKKYRHRGATLEIRTDMDCYIVHLLLCNDYFHFYSLVVVEVLDFEEPKM